MPMAQTHAPLSYNKWDDFGEEDEDGPGTSEPATPMLASAKKDAQIDADNQMYERFRNYMKAYFKGKYPLAQRKLLARFIAVAHEGAEESNAFRYPDIMGLSSQVAHPAVRRTTPRRLRQLSPWLRQLSPRRRLPFPSPPPALSAAIGADGPRVHRSALRAAQEDDQRRQGGRPDGPPRRRWQGARRHPGDTPRVVVVVATPHRARASWARL